MYYAMHLQFTKMLTNLGHLLDKAQAYAEGRKFDPNNLVTARLAPDMYTLTRQIQASCDAAKFAAARLTGQEAPRHEDNEQTLADLKARVQKCLAFLTTLKAEHYHGASDRRITLPWADGKSMAAPDYLIEMAIPNFYFHVTAAYAILRHNGVEIGKMDFIGSIKLT